MSSVPVTPLSIHFEAKCRKKDKKRKKGNKMTNKKKELIT